MPLDELATPPKGPNTLKSQEILMGELQRENFNLKLRIYHMEEQMRQVIPGDAGQTVKRNIELTVQVDEMQKDLGEKTNLLLKAQRSIDAIAASMDGKLEASRTELAGKSRELSSSRTQIEQLEVQLKEMQRQNSEADRQYNTARTRVQELEQGLRMAQTSDADAIASLESERRTDKETILMLQEKIDARANDVRETATERDRARLLEHEVTEWRTKALAYEQKLQTHASDPELAKVKDETILELRRRLAGAEEQLQKQHQQLQQQQTQISQHQMEMAQQAAQMALQAVKQPPTHTPTPVAPEPDDRDLRIYQMEQASAMYQETQAMLHQEIAGLRAAAAEGTVLPPTSPPQPATNPTEMAEKDQIIVELSGRVVQLEQTVQAVAAQSQSPDGGGSALLLAKEQTIASLRARIQTVEDLNASLSSQINAETVAAASNPAADAQVGLLEGQLIAAQTEASNLRAACRQSEAQMAELQTKLAAKVASNNNETDSSDASSNLQNVNRALKEQVAQCRASQADSEAELDSANTRIAQLQRKVDRVEAERSTAAAHAGASQSESTSIMSEVFKTKDQMIGLLESRISELEGAIKDGATGRVNDVASQASVVADQTRRIAQLEEELGAAEKDKRNAISDLTQSVAMAAREADHGRVVGAASSEKSMILDELKAKLAAATTGVAEADAEVTTMRNASRAKDQVIAEMTARLAGLQDRARSDIGATAASAAAAREQTEAVMALRAQLQIKIAEAETLRDELRARPLDDESNNTELLRARLATAEDRAAAAEQRLRRGFGGGGGGGGSGGGGRGGRSGWDEPMESEALEAAERLAAQLRDAREERDRMAFRLRTAETRAEDALKRVDASDSAVRSVQRASDEGAVATAALISDLQTQKDEVQRRLAEADAVIAELQTTLDIQSSKVEEAAAQLSEQERYIGVIGEENRKITGEIAVLRTVEDDLARAREQVVRLSTELDNVKSDRKQAERSMHEQEDMIVQLRNRSVAFEGEARIARSVAKETEENDATIMRDLKTRLDRLSEELADRDEDVRRLKDSYVDKETELRHVQRAADRSHALAQEQEQDIRHLVDQIRALEEDGVNLRRKVVDLEGAVYEQGVMQATMDELARSIANKEDQIAALDADRREISAQLLAAEDDLLGSRETVIIERASIEQLEQLVQTRDATVARLTEEVAVLSECQVRERLRAEEVDRLSRLCDERDEKIRDLVTSLQSVTMQLAHAQLKMTLTPEELAVLRADLDHTRATAAHFSADLEARDRTVAELEKINADLTERGIRDLDTLANREAELASLLDIRRVKDDVEAEAQKLTIACESLSGELERVKAACAAAELAKLEHEAACRHARDESTILLEERRALDMELQHQVAGRGEMLSKITKLEDRLADTLAAQATAEEERNLYRQQTVTLADDVESLSRHLSTADADRQNLNDRVAALQLSLSERQAIDSAERTVRVFRQNYTLEDVIGSHA
jgi:chromosome segregation ATPase